MRCRFKNLIWLAAVLLAVQAVTGCVSLRIEKVQEGADLLPPRGEFMREKTSLGEILAYHGAPAEVVEMSGDFALHYRRALSRGMSFSIGLPLKYALLPNPSLRANGDLLRYDTAVFIFSQDGVLKDMQYEKGTQRPLWKDYWQ